MFTRVRPVRGVRLYSSENKEGALFLSDLMKRIDSINERSKSLKGPEKSKKPVKAPSFMKKPEVYRTKVKDHPLSANTFQLMDNSNRKAGGARTGGARRFDGPRKDGAQRNAGGPRPPRKDGPKKFGRPTAKPRVAALPHFAPKVLLPKSYEPTVLGDTFFYGKATTTVHSLTSRVAAVAKEALLKSKYPFKLPRSIVKNLDSTVTANPFILQKDFNLEVNEQELGDRVKQVVKGEVQQLTIDQSKIKKDTLAAALSASDLLMRNGSYSLAQKQTVFDVAAGLKPVLLLLQNAHWNK